jgi:hypothetical protein
MVDRLLQIIHHVAGWFLAQQFAKRMQTGKRIVNVALFPRGKNGMANRHKQLKRRLLAQHRLGINAPGVAEQRCQQRGGIRDTGFCSCVCRAGNT